MLKYTTLATLKTFLGIEGSDQDTELQELIDRGTELLDLELGENLELQTKTKRFDGQGAYRIHLERIPNSVTSIHITSNEGYTWTSVDLDDDPIEGYAVYAKSELPRGTRNVKVVYQVGYAEVPTDLEDFFLHYLKTLKDVRDDISAGKDPFDKVKTKRLEGLSVTYFSPGELATQYNGSNPFTVNYERILQKYKIFSVYTTL